MHGTTNIKKVYFKLDIHDQLLLQQQQQKQKRKQQKQQQQQQQPLPLPQQHNNNNNNNIIIKPLCATLYLIVKNNHLRLFRLSLQSGLLWLLMCVAKLFDDAI